MKKEYKILIFISIFLLAYILLFLSKFNFNPSATIELSEGMLQGFEGTIPVGVVIHKTDGFDGQIYYVMALNPEFNQIKGVSPHFFQRMVYPLLAIGFALGFKSLIPLSMLLINFFSVILTSFVLMQILKKYKANLNLVYLWAFSVAILITIIRNLTAPLMALFIILFIYFMERENHVTASLFLSLALLTRELALPIYAFTLLYFFIKLDFKKFGIYFLAIIPFVIWQVLLMNMFGVIPAGISFFSVSKPIVGPADYLFNLDLSELLQVIEIGDLNSLREANKYFSPLPVLIFAIIQLVILIIVFIKDKKITKYTILVLSQLVVVFALRKAFFYQYEVDALGRYAITLFLFSVLYYAEKKEKYNKFLRFLSILLIILSLISAILYFIEKIIFFNPSYYLN